MFLHGHCTEALLETACQDLESSIPGSRFHLTASRNSRREMVAVAVNTGRLAVEELPREVRREVTAVLPVRLGTGAGLLLAAVAAGNADQLEEGLAWVRGVRDRLLGQLGNPSDGHPSLQKSLDQGLRKDLYQERVSGA